MSEPHDFPDLEQYARSLAMILKPNMPEGVGFTLFLYGYFDDPRMAYISTADREDMIRLVKEWLAKQEA
jgi:hypothetical protein